MEQPADAENSTEPPPETPAVAQPAQPAASPVDLAVLADSIASALAMPDDPHPTNGSCSDDKDDDKDDGVLLVPEGMLFAQPRGRPPHDSSGRKMVWDAKAGTWRSPSLGEALSPFFFKTNLWLLQQTYNPLSKCIVLLTNPCVLLI